MKFIKRNSGSDMDQSFPYYTSDSFHKHRQNILHTISGLPYQSSPKGWSKASSFAVGGLEYIGCSNDSKYLLIVSSSGRGILDFESNEIVARDYDNSNDWLDERNLVCEGFGFLENQRISITGIGGGGLPKSTGTGESLYLAAPLYPCYDVIYQPDFQNCLSSGRNQDCAIIYRGFVNYYGFSADGNTMLVADEDIHVWRKNLSYP